MAYHNAREYDEKLIDFGWVPGDYVQTCRTCMKRHLEAKGAWNCDGCAEKAMKNDKKPKVEKTKVK